MKKRKRRVRLGKFTKVLLGCVNILSILFSIFLCLLDVLPASYFILVVCILVCFVGLMDIGLLLKSKWQLFFHLFAIIYSLIMFVVVIYEGYTYFFLNGITSKNVSKETYQVYVLEDSSYSKIEDLNNKTIGLLNSNEEGIKDAESTLSSKIDFEKEDYTDSTSLIEDLKDEKIDGIVLSSSSYDIAKENEEELVSNLKCIYDFTIEIMVEDTTKRLDVTKEPFTVYISGIDTYGSVSSVSRSDVNIIVTVNPKTKSVEMIHIPRDYYVTLNGKNKKDKLTHAGIYGIDTSIKTIEDLLDVEINYYVRLNFTSLVKVVDALGGIEVDSPRAFTTGIYDSGVKASYTFKKGINKLNGEETLSFVRERHAFQDGDRVRGENQMLVLKALINKCMSTSILKNYLKLLNSLSSSFVTNLSEKEITSLVKMQLSKNSSWSIDSLELDGTSSYEYTYSYPHQKLYVMVPNEETLTEAKEKIQTIIQGS